MLKTQSIWSYFDLPLGVKVSLLFMDRVLIIRSDIKIFTIVNNNS